MNRMLILFTAASLLLAGAAFAENSDAENPLATLQAEHPRLLLTDARLAELKQLARTDAKLNEAADSAVALARLYLDKPPVIDGTNWNTWRESVARIFATAFAWRWTGDRAFFDKARETLLADAAFENWHDAGGSFLDTGEMTLAVSVGYDWLYADLSPADRETIRTAIVEKGLKAGLKAYNGGAWWINCNHNWNLVCNSGMVIGALAVGDTNPDAAGPVLAAALKSMPKALASYKPDGAWMEGPYYWEYATRYGVMALASLQTALGTDFGLADNEGLAATWKHAAYVTAPDNLHEMAYADSLEHHWTLPFLFWTARRYDQPLASRFQMRYFGKPHPWWSDPVKEAADPRHAPNRVLDIIWYTPPLPETPPLAEALPRDAVLRGLVELASFRSSWNDSKALWLLVKAGKNGGLVNHGHCDVGSFELWADGIRWSLDPGREGYGPNYFDVGHSGKPGKRWSFPKTRASGHSTLLIGDGDQDPFGTAPIVKFDTSDELAFAIVDLSNVYPQARTARRGFQVIDRNAVLVQDELELDVDREVTWAMDTEADAKTDGAEALLTRWGKTLRAKILEPADATFEFDKQSRRLLCRVKMPAGAHRLAILLTPPGEAAPSVELKPLDQWEVDE